jgi:hypothetical protein
MASGKFGKSVKDSVGAGTLGALLLRRDDRFDFAQRQRAQADRLQRTVQSLK